MNIRYVRSRFGTLVLVVVLLQLLNACKIDKNSDRENKHSEETFSKNKNTSVNLQQLQFTILGIKDPVQNLSIEKSALIRENKSLQQSGYVILVPLNSDDANQKTEDINEHLLDEDHITMWVPLKSNEEGLKLSSFGKMLKEVLGNSKSKKNPYQYSVSSKIEGGKHVLKVDSGSGWKNIEKPANVNLLNKKTNTEVTVEVPNGLFGDLVRWSEMASSQKTFKINGKIIDESWFKDMPSGDNAGKGTAIMRKIIDETGEEPHRLATFLTLVWQDAANAITFKGAKSLKGNITSPIPDSAKVEFNFFSAESKLAPVLITTQKYQVHKVAKGKAKLKGSIEVRAEQNIRIREGDSNLGDLEVTQTYTVTPLELGLTSSKGISFLNHGNMQLTDFVFSLGSAFHQGKLKSKTYSFGNFEYEVTGTVAHIEELRGFIFNVKDNQIIHSLQVNLPQGEYIILQVR